MQYKNSIVALDFFVKVCHDTFTSIMPYSMGGTHPRF